MKKYLLSQSQFGIYSEYIQHPDLTQYNHPCYFRFLGKIDLQKLKYAIQSVLKTYPIFYNKIVEQDEEIYQYPDCNLRIEIPIEYMPEEKVLQRLKQFIRPFDLHREALSRFLLIETPEANYFVHDIHHIIMDGKTISVMYHFIELAYNNSDLPAQALPFYEYTEQEVQMLQTPQYTRSAEYYTKKFQGIKMTKMPGELNTKPGMLRQVSAFIPKEKVDLACEKNRIRPSWLFMSAFEIVLSRFSRENTIAYATALHGRNEENLQDTLGMLVKTAPVLARTDHRMKVIDYINTHKAELAAIRANDIFPFTHFCRQLGVVPEITFGFQGRFIKDDISFLSENVVRVHMVERESPQKPVIVVYDNETEYDIRMQYVDCQYAPSTIQQFAEAIAVCVEQMIASPEKTLKDISILSSDEHQELITLGKGEELSYDLSETFIDVFSKQASRTPDAVAIVYNQQSYTYKEIDEITTHLAVHLQKYGAGREKVVGIMIERSEWMAIYPLAVMKAGAAYMPLDSKLPAERIAYMVQEAQVDLILSEEGLLEVLLPEFKGKILSTSEALSLPETHGVLPHRAAPEDMAVILYTSGSTGQPKGCILEHRNLMNFCQWYVKDFCLTSEDRGIAYANFGFDAHMMDLYPLLSCGGTVYIIPSSMRMDLAALNAYIEAQKITIAFLTTQIGAQIAATFHNRSLRLLSVGGEKLPPIKKPSYRLYNGYGPTECTIYSTFYEVKKDFDNELIGRPLANYQLYVVDPQLNLLPRGAAGELCVAGPGLARGYLNRPDLTSEKFVKLNGNRVYRTGDLVRWAENANLQYLGRIDNQVKLRGFRIELGEIEEAMSRYQGIKSAVVEVKELGGVQHLCGYYTSDEPIDEPQLRDYLSLSLTDYMVPTAFMRLEVLPLTPNGKVDRRILPVPVVERKENYEAPTNKIEEAICSAFAELLKIDRVGINDSFFNIGGTSISAIKAVIQLSNLNYQINYGDLFKLKTPRALARFIDSQVYEGKEDGLDHQFDFSRYDYTGINRVLSENKHDLWNHFNLRPYGRILLTGPTGYLGIHLLHYLLMNSDSEICSVVRSNPNGIPRNRLKALMAYYFNDDWESYFDARVKIIEGDITDNDLNQKLKEEAIDTVFNCAAIVKHYVTENTMETVNIDGVANLISLCTAKEALLVHISTYSVGGTVEKDKPHCLSEQDLYIGQETDNEYVRTKFIAERIILQAIADRKLKAKIMRVGNLMGREIDGEFQINFNSNAFVSSLKSYKVLGAFPVDDMTNPVEISPIDRVAEAVAKLATTPQEMIVFHPYNNYKINMAAIIKSFNDYGYKIEVTSNSHFLTRVSALMHDPDQAIYLQGLIHSGKLGEGLSRVESLNDYTTRVLYRLGFYWGIPHADYITKLIRMLDGLGFFEDYNFMKKEITV